MDENAKDSYVVINAKTGALWFDGTEEDFQFPESVEDFEENVITFETEEEAKEVLNQFGYGLNEIIIVPYETEKENLKDILVSSELPEDAQEGNFVVIDEDGKVLSRTSNGKLLFLDTTDNIDGGLSVAWKLKTDDKKLIEEFLNNLGLDIDYWEVLPVSEAFAFVDEELSSKGFSDNYEFEYKAYNHAGVGYSLSNFAFGLTQALRKERFPFLTNIGIDSQIQAVTYVLEEAIKKGKDPAEVLNISGLGYRNWKTIEKKDDFYKLQCIDTLGNEFYIEIKVKAPVEDTVEGSAKIDNSAKDTYIMYRGKQLYNIQNSITGDIIKKDLSKSEAQDLLKELNNVFGVTFYGAWDDAPLIITADWFDNFDEAQDWYNAVTNYDTALEYVAKEGMDYVTAVTLESKNKGILDVTYFEQDAMFDERMKELRVSSLDTKEVSSTEKIRGNEFVVIDEDGKVLSDYYNSDHELVTGYIDTVDDPDGGYSRAHKFTSKTQAERILKGWNYLDGRPYEILDVVDAFAFVDEDIETSEQEEFVVIDEDGKVLSHLNKEQIDFIDTVDDPDGGYKRAVKFRSSKDAEEFTKTIEPDKYFEVLSVKDAFAFVDEEL